LKYPTELTGKEILGFYIHEPSAMLSNFAIVAACATLLVLHREVIDRSANHWKKFALFLGLAGAGGMVSHGLPTYLGPDLYFLIWWVKNSFVLLANYSATLAVFGLTKVSKNKLVLYASIKVIAGITLLYFTFDFLPAAIDLAITYISILVITWKRTDQKGAKFLKRGFLVALFSGIFYLFPFSILNDWFNNKDAVHLFAVVSLALVSRAMSAMDDQQTSAHVPES